MLKWIWDKVKGSNVVLPKDYWQNIDPEAVEILKILNRAGFESYLVGGCVRDILLKKKPKDFDIATKASPNQVKSLVKRSFIIGRRFRIVVAKRNLTVTEMERDAHELFPVIRNKNFEKEFQITTFRRDPEERDGQVNENVFGSAKEDAYRRDFTVNALFLDTGTHKIVDFVGGLEDLSKRLLRIIGNPKERFVEDPIRILRAIRFLHRANLKFESQTKQAVLQCLDELGNAKRERIREEMIKILREGHAEKVFQEFQQLGLWKHLMPLLSAHFTKHPASFDVLIKISKAVDHCPWKQPQDSAPLLFLFFADLLLPLRKGGAIDHQDLNALFEELKVTKNEKDFMHSIYQTLERLSHDPQATHANRILQKNPRFTNHQIQVFYVLKVLADAGFEPFLGIWKVWESSWKDQLNYLRSGAAWRPRPSGPRGGRRRPPRGPAKAP